MSNSASYDANFVPTKLAALNTDGRTIVPITVNPVSHALKMSDGISGSNHGPTNALRDVNNIPVMMGVSSSDYATPVVVYANINGAVLIQTS